MAIATFETPAPRHLFRRPTNPTGLWNWFTTIDHKKIGLLYLGTAFTFFIVGGIEALVIRLQLGGPNGHVVDANTYNQIFTMHGTTMIFLVVMPLSAGLANYLVPLMIGARDVAFPRLNALGYWVFVIGGLFMYSSFLFGHAPNGGWFGYAPNTEKAFNPAHNCSATRSWCSRASPSPSWAGACGPTTCSPPDWAPSPSRRSPCRRCSSPYQRA